MSAFETPIEPPSTLNLHHILCTVVQRSAVR